MTLPFSVRLDKAAFYLAGFAIAYLAGVYFGGFFMTMLYLFLFLPFVAILQLVTTWVSIKYHQDFSTNHPLKGQEVKYTITISKESFIPSAHVVVRFKSSQEDTNPEFADIHECPSRDRAFVSVKTIKCPFRGIYTVGLESLHIEDALRWLKVSLPVWYRTFYVYPRIIELASVRFGIQGHRTSITGTVDGTVQDYTLFETLRGYRAGDPVRHIAWKKFASTGEPLIKTYDTTAQPGVTVYLDTRRSGTATYETLAAEDCSIEILVAIVKHLIERDIPVAVHAAGWERYRFAGYNEPLFYRFHHNTVNILFKPGPSPVELFHADLADNRLSTNSVLFITHMLDPEVLSLLGSTGGKELSTAGIFNLSGLDRENKEKARHLLQTLKETNGKVFIVNDTESIKEDLE